jgi:hypothetical protein
MPESDGSISFQRDIRPLFREIDIDHMSPMGVMLDQYDYMSGEDNAQAVYESLTGEQQPQMPIGGPYWDAEQLALFEKWMAGGRKP